MMGLNSFSFIFPHLRECAQLLFICVCVYVRFAIILKQFFIL